MTYTNKSGETEHAPDQDTINVCYNGPLYLHGDLSIEDTPDDMQGVQYRASLCRCGHSKNMPFCDNSHIEVGFQDFGAIGETGTGLQSKDGKLEVKPTQDGPLQISGNVSMVTASGRVAWQGEKLWLCRCGESKNKPFCDGTHKKVGFRSD